MSLSPLHLHADLHEAGDDAGILAERTMAFGGHAGELIRIWRQGVPWQPG